MNHDEVISKAKELKISIENEEIIEEYQRIKALFENDESLKQMRKNIAKAKANNDKTLYDNLMEMYVNNPLVRNYMEIEKEAIDLLKEIGAIIN